MKAVIQLDLNVEQAEDAKRIVEETCTRLRDAGAIGGYRYEIETPEGPVTERCVLAEGRVIA
ncbi:MAG: hypothetical protein HPY67_13985 [Syntrophaceae bacterium]|nr:hypothetical protein [Syntrophaceae bacterium]